MSAIEAKGRKIGNNRSRIRWWPAAGIVILYLGLLARCWWLVEQSRQDRVMQTFALSFLGLVLLLLWFLLASRAPGKWRLAVLAVAIVGGFVASQALTVTGVSGDLVPIIGFKGSTAGGPGDEVTPAPIAASLLATAATGDYSQFLGPERNAGVPGVRLARDWQTSPPREIWRRPVGPAWSGFAIHAGWAVTQEQHEDQEQVVAYELATGEVRWRHADAVRYETTIGGIGPRATPTIAEGVVYTLGATGILNALELESGKRMWARDILKEHGANNREWGKSCSPLVVGDLVVVSVGATANKSVAAYDRATGELAWTGGSDTSSYSSPVLVTLAGREQIVMRNQHSVTAHDPETGAVLWNEDWPGETPNVAVPLVLGDDRVLISSGYGVGSKVYRVSAGESGLSTEMLWESPRLKAKFTNLVEHGGYVYGLDDGILVCLDPATGERCWKRGRYGHGQVILAGDLLLLTSEKGEVFLIEPNPDELRELDSFRAFDGKTWNPPALAGRLLLLRTDKEAALYELPVAG